MFLCSCFGVCLLIFYCLPVTTGQSNLICSPQPIVAFAGDDVILPCRLDPPISASSRAVEWTRPGLDPEYIHVHQDGRLVHQSQNPLYHYRTVLFVDQLVNGNVSLKLLRMKNSDAGIYKCFLPSLWKEASIQLVVEDSVMAPSSCTASTAMSVLFGLMFVFTVVLFVWKWRQYNNGFKTQLKRKKEERDREETAEQQALMEEKRSKKQLMTENKKMKEELQKQEEELKTMRQVTHTLGELKNELEKQKGKLTDQMEKAQRRAKENEEKVNSVEKEVTEREGDKTANKALGYSKLKEIITENNWNLEERKKELQQLHMNTNKLMKRTIDHFNRMTGDNMKEREDTVENNVEQK